MPDQRHHLTGPQLERDVGHGGALGVGVAEGDVVEDDALAQGRARPGAAASGSITLGVSAMNS